MSNRITVEPTEFKNQRTGHITTGVRVYDNYDQTYDNTWDSIPDDDMEVLVKVIECDETIMMGMMDFISENETGVFIGETYYEWEQIKHLFNT